MTKNKKDSLESIKISLEIERAYNKIHAWFFAFPEEELNKMKL